LRDSKDRKSKYTPSQKKNRKSENQKSIPFRTYAIPYWKGVNLRKDQGERGCEKKSGHTRVTLKKRKKTGRGGGA